jgi:hypothetical protein
MVLEAIEDHLRGWRNGKHGLGEERVARGKLAIEHVMPRKWVAHWPLEGPKPGEADRDRIIHTLGNLTLLTGRLNSKVSNGPWAGDGGKREGIQQNDVLLLNREILKQGGDQWTDDAIRVRTRRLTEIIIQIWPVPTNHRSGFSADKPRLRKKVDLADLINAGKLVPGMSLFPRRQKFSERVATLLPDGRIEIDDTPFSSPSQAAHHIVGHGVNGWWFFLIDKASRTSLRTVRRDYVDSLAVDVEDDEVDEEADDEA